MVKSLRAMAWALPFRAPTVPGMGAGRVGIEVGEDHPDATWLEGNTVTPADQAEG